MPAIDSAVLDEWHVLGAISDLPPGRVRQTCLLGVELAALRRPDGGITVRCTSSTEAGAGGEPLPVRLAYDHLWTTLGKPDHELFDLPEFFEADRRNIVAGSFGVHVSAPRAVENFLDLGHFPFVHGGYLGVEPFTEVKDYEVAISPDSREIVARRCRFYQPLATLAAKEGFEVEYIYRVPHPYCAVLYKTSALDPNRNDVVTIFAQPVGEERINASMLLCWLDHESSDQAMRRYQQLIFGQDKPILENQRPRRLPLDPRAETPIRADASALTYRHWLRRRGVRYGTIPAAPPAREGGRADA